ncbi:GABA permease [Paraburkholderia nemoris]|uniref:GABA permease n=1 Tax=Paraburkholderia nemoris TaxID=2793076 RepID=A0ABM8SXU3_9BURK|nr:MULTISPECIES: GABA permease [Paraburkholderia]MBK3815237.1 GABA permease [Paraburkholderia aspalathi]CAE6714350.1 putative GABA permease [Paraburkholderia nemoris]CAE6840122.1 putative GABA permease [Paraburkholderia nemoris]
MHVPPVPGTTDANQNSSLTPGFKQRHVTMISIAGVIGAGLFVASGRAIAAAGPASILAYLVAGLLVVLVMRMLGEMAVASPDTGSFSTYADRAIGNWAGFTIGWLYWWFWVLVTPLEAIAAGTILNSYVPSVDVWMFSLSIIALLTVTNLTSVQKYGEFEFWFAMLKVVSIIAFIAFGAAAIAGLVPTANVSGVARLARENGGLMPNGFGAVVGALLTTIFSFMGTEVITIAAAESTNPAQQISKATRSVIWRICIFYLGSIFVVISVVPWNDPLLPLHGSYQRALELLHVPYAKTIIDIVVLVAVASCLNSAIYISSRMLFSLSKRGDAPVRFGRTSGKGVPHAAVLGSTVIGIMVTASNFFAPSAVFAFLLSGSGAIALLVYLVIAVSQLRMRSTLAGNAAHIECRMWLFPYLTWAVILVISTVLVLMILLPDHRYEVMSTGALAASITAIGLLRSKRLADPAVTAPATRTE